MLRKILLLGGLFTLLAACSSGYTYELAIDDAEGLTAGQPVLRQGVEVGEVTDVDLDREEVVLTIRTDEPLYEDQDFYVDRNDDREKILALGRPDRDAAALASGSRIKDRGLEIDLDLDGLEGLGVALEHKLEDFLGNNEEKLEDLGRRLENWAESFEGRAEDWGRDMEEWGQEMEDWARENEDEFQELEEKLERWKDENEDKVDDFERDFARITRDHNIGSREWRREVEKLVKSYNDR